MNTNRFHSEDKIKMGRLQRERWRSKLSTALSRADNEDFILALWAVDRLQNGNELLASKVLTGFPPDSVGATITSKFRIHPWELETLANECLTTNKHRPRRHPFLRLNSRNWSAIWQVVVMLRRLEDEEYAASGYDVLKEMSRIASRQFEWQRGFFNKALIYRTAVIYSHPDLNQRLFKKTGLRLDDFLYCAFSLYVYFIHFGALSSEYELDQIRINRTMRDAALRVFANDFATAIDLARLERRPWSLTAYRPSILRRYPILKTSGSPEQFLCPLPDLIIDRATSGIFYDVIDSSGTTRNALGRGFETYVSKLLPTLPGAKTSPEFRYKVRKNLYDSPDFFITENDRTFCIVECKANRFSFPARYKDHPEAERGYEELAKGAFQIWRFVSHCRNNDLNIELESSPVGMVLTLDPWLSFAEKSRAKVMQLADRKCFESDVAISKDDKIPIVFCNVTDLEFVLWRCSLASFKSALRDLSQEKKGWLLSTAHEPDATAIDQGFPFDDMADYLPWFEKLEER